MSRWWCLMLRGAAIILLFIIAGGHCYDSIEKDGDIVSFEEWTKVHGRNYGSTATRKYREQIFKTNMALVKSLNDQYRAREVQFRLNQFADLTNSEFKSIVLMKPSGAPVFSRNRYRSDISLSRDLPDTFDWRDKGVVSPVKDQGSVGSCWAFSTVGNIEGQWALKGNKLTSLSAEQLVDCDATFDPNNMNTDCGVFGGWPYLAYQYIMRVGGIEAEEDYPYCSGFGKCFPCQAPGYNKTRCGPPVPVTSCLKNESCNAKLNTSRFLTGLKLKSWIAIEKNESIIQSELVRQGPLSIAINAMVLQFYHSGVWDPLLPCSNKSLDHAVLLVGYGTHHGLFASKPYWLVKNSWGERWGQKGYFMMVRGKGKCGVNEQVTSAVLQDN